MATPDPVGLPQPSHNATVSSAPASPPLAPWWRRLAWLPIPLLVAALVAMWVANLRVVWPLPPLNWLVHYGSVALGVGFIVVPAARSFLASGQPSVLMLGCGVLMMDLGVLAMPAASARSADAGFAIYNTSVLLSALSHFAGVAIASRRRVRLRHSARWLTATYAGGTVAMGLVIAGAWAGWLPRFFLDGYGGTLLRTLVVSATVALFVLTAGLLWQTHRRTAAPFLYWYALGLVLLAAGLAGSLAIAVKDSPLQWFARITQFIGGIYMCVAVLTSARASGVQAIPLAAVEEAWRANVFLADLRRQTPLGWVSRYALALVAVAAAFGLRVALTAWVGPGLPTYVTFYPAVMAVALLAGLGPGLLATVVAGAVVGYWILPPVGQLAIASHVDRLGLAIFTGMGVCISAVAELYRHHRDQAAAYARAAAVRESQARLATFAEATFEGIVESEAGRIVDCNEQYARMLGYSVAELRGREIADFVAPEDRDRVMANIRLGREADNEHTVLRQDGTRIVVETHGRPVSSGSARRHTAIRDITARKRQEEELRQLNRILQAGMASHQARTAATDESEYLHQVCRIVVETCGHAMVWIGYAQDDAAKSVLPVAHAGLDQGYLDTLAVTWADTERGRGPTGTAIRTGEPSACNDMRTDPRLAPWRAQALQRGYAASLVLPLRGEGKTFGAMTLYATQPNAFTPEEVRLLTELADDLAQGVTALRLRDAHARAEAALARNEADLREAQRVAHVGSWSWDARTDVTSGSAELLRLYGFDPATQRMPDFRDQRGRCYPVADWERVNAAVQETLRSGAGYELDVQALRNGAPLWITTRGEAVRDATGQMVGLRGTVQDISDRKRSEREREATVEFLHLVNASTGVHDLIEASVRFFRKQSGCEAVGIRLRDSDDYPYYETHGFPAEFVQLENSLCVRDEDGEVERDAAGNPVMACMCGNVICGRFDPAQPFFTPAGSFWANDTTRLLATTTEADRQDRTRNRCNGAGYESVALIALRVGEQRLGLLQLNDRRRNMFTPELIALWERLAGYLAVALAKAKADEALRESEVRFRSVLAGSRDCIYRINLRTGRYEYISPAVESIVGFSPAEIAAQDAEAALAMIHPDDLPAMRTALARLEETGDMEAEYRQRAKDGGYRWISNRMALTRDGAGRPLYRSGNVRDIAQRKQAEEALRRSEASYRTLFNTLLEGFCIVEVVFDAQDRPVDYRFLEVNPAFEKQTGLHQAQGKLMRSLAPDHEAHWFEIYGKIALTGEPARFENQAQALHRWYDVSAFRVGGPESHQVAILFNDITERKRAEERLRQLNATLEQRVTERTAEVEQRVTQLRQLHAELSQAEQRERRELATLLHDGLQQMLVAAKMRVGMARTRAGEAARPVLDQVDELLAQSIDASRSLTIELSPPVLRDRGLVPAFHWLARQMQEKQKLAVEVLATEDAEAPTEDVRLLLFQATRELLFNVVKHAGVDHALVALRRADGELRLQVIDTGKGFDAARFRGPDRLTASFGLFSVHQRLEWLGGEMEIESAVGAGTRVTLRVPIVTPAPGAAPPSPLPARMDGATSLAAPAARPAGRRLRVVLADDHKMVREGLVGLLAACPDLEVVAQAADGQMAVDLAQRVQPDVVVMDISMPQVDGIEATRRLKLLMPHVPVIGLSMHESPEMAQAILAAGAVAYLRKDGPVEDLIAAIQRCQRRAPAGG